MIYVEDDAARAIVESLCALVVVAKYGHQVPPTVKVVPIGPFESVIRFLGQHSAILPTRTKAFALLDGDVKAENVAAWEATKNYGQLQRLEVLKGMLDFLPWTPEVAIVNDFRAHRAVVEKQLRKAFGDPGLVLDAAIFANLDGQDAAALRKSAKAILSQVCASIAKGTVLSTDDVARQVSDVFAKRFFSASRNDAMALLGPKLM